MFRVIICLVVIAFLTTIHGLNFTGSDIVHSNGSPTRLQRSESTNHCYFTAGLTYVADEPRSRVDCFFNENQACYAFVDVRNKSEVKYGCGNADVKELPKRCADQGNKVHCEDDYVDFKFGKVCCCKGANCNSFQNIKGEIVPKPEPTTTTTTPTTTEVAVTTSEEDEAIGMSLMGLIIVTCILLVVVIVMCGCHCYTLSKMHTMEQEFDVRSRKLKEHLDRRDAALMAQCNNTMADNVRKQVTRLWNMCSANAVKLSAALDSQAERSKAMYEAPSSISVDRSFASNNAADGTSKSSKACWPCKPHENKTNKYADIPLTPAHLYPPHTEQPIQSKHVSKPAEFRSLHPTASNESIPTTRPHQ